MSGELSTPVLWLIGVGAAVLAWLILDIVHNLGRWLGSKADLNEARVEEIRAGHTLPELIERGGPR